MWHHHTCRWDAGKASGSDRCHTRGKGEILERAMCDSARLCVFVCVCAGLFGWQCECSWDKDLRDGAAVFRVCCCDFELDVCRFVSFPHVVLKFADICGFFGVIHTVMLPTQCTSQQYLLVLPTCPVITVLLQLFCFNDREKPDLQFQSDHLLSPNPTKLKVGVSPAVVV